MVTISMGNKKKQFRSIKEAAEYVGMPYLTLYMRLRFGEKAASAMQRPIRKYRRRVAA